jgi:uncharacterized protein (DUF4415 family)
MRKPSRTQWDRIDAMKDEEIDYSDNPKLDVSFLAKSVRWPGPKELISLRLDREVLAFFRSQGKGYQTTINTLLRKYMEAQVQPVSSHRSEKRARKK